MCCGDPVPLPANFRSTLGSDVFRANLASKLSLYRGFTARKADTVRVTLLNTKAAPTLWGNQSLVASFAEAAEGSKALRVALCGREIFDGIQAKAEVKLFVGVTNDDWFRFLAGKEPGRDQFLASAESGNDFKSPKVGRCIFI